MSITLINQATFLLRRLIERQQEQFLANGGVREQMTRARLQARSMQGRNGRSDRSGKPNGSDMSDGSDMS